MLIVCGKGRKGGGVKETKRRAILEKEEFCNKVGERWKRRHRNIRNWSMLQKKRLHPPFRPSYYSISYFHTGEQETAQR
jgi:hypothetical protein